MRAMSGDRDHAARDHQGLMQLLIRQPDIAATPAATQAHRPTAAVLPPRLGKRVPWELLDPVRDLAGNVHEGRRDNGTRRFHGNLLPVSHRRLQAVGRIAIYVPGMIRVPPYTEHGRQSLTGPSAR